MITHYLINCETSALISYFQNGFEYTQVIEGKLSFLVSQSPDEIVKEPLSFMLELNWEGLLNHLEVF